MNRVRSLLRMCGLLLEYSFEPTIMDKSLGTLLRFWGVFQFTQVQPLPSAHKECWTRVSRISTLYRLGGGRTARKFRKGYTVLRGNREMTEKYEYCSTVPRTFVQDCRPYSRALGTAGSVMIIGLSINKCSHSKIIQFDEREQD